MDLNLEKGLCLLIFFLVTLVPGASTVLLFSRCQARLASRGGRATLSLLKCFAGGVFFSTCLMGLVAEGLDEYEEFREVGSFVPVYPFFHLGIGVGFFLVAYMERLAFCISGHHVQAEETAPRGDVKLETFKNKVVEGDESCKKAEEKTETCPAVVAECSKPTVVAECSKPAVAECSKSTVAAECSNPTASECSEVDCCELAVKETTTPPNQCTDIPAASHRKHSSASNSSHISSHSTGSAHSSEEGSSSVRAIIFLLALSFHTLFDGLAVGLQDTDTDLWAMTIAITVHKAIMVTSLALELCMTLPGKTLKVLLLLLLFALMTPVGVAIGMGVTSGHVDVHAQLLVGSVLQAVAAGSVLYVTFFEILGEELGHHSSVLKVTVTVFGFATIAVAKIWDTD